MNFDITYTIMIPALVYFAKLMHSYGWAIVLLTLAVRIAIWPIVASSTRSMLRMSKLQPYMQSIQTKYKSDPEMLQKKTMEFYMANKINPLGGCLPLLVQFPIFIALFGTFNGPPFSDRPIDVPIKVVAKAQAQEAHREETSKNTSAYVDANGNQAKIAVFPGDSTIVEGESLDFGTRAVQGQLPKDFGVKWKVVGSKDAKPLNERVKIEENGHCQFLAPGEYHLQAMVPGIVKNESFFFIRSLGKSAHGLDLLKPENFDTLSMLLLFAVTMVASQKLSLGNQPKIPESEMTEQQLIQKQTAQIMPVTFTLMMAIYPMPMGVWIYFVVSNLFQTFQTWVLSRMPLPELVDVTGGDGPGGGGATADKPKSGGGGGKAETKTSGQSDKSSAKDKQKKQEKDETNNGGGVDEGQSDESGGTINLSSGSSSADSEDGGTINLSVGKRKVKKKKK